MNCLSTKRQNCSRYSNASTSRDKNRQKFTAGNFCCAGIIWFSFVEYFCAQLALLPLLTIFVCLAVSELANALNLKSNQVRRNDLLLLTPILLISAYFGGLQALLISFGLGIMFLIITTLRSGIDDFNNKISKSVFALTYLPFMAAFVLIMLNQDSGPLRVLAFILLTVASDTGAYFSGIIFGRHSMAPSISPAKTWEGFAGGLGLQIAMGALVFTYFFEAALWKGLVAGALLTITAVLGDLLESAIKRDAGVKDMSGILPGHGGVLDRLDSLIPNALVAWAVFSWLLT